jgi:hypothetical protein
LQDIGRQRRPSGYERSWRLIDGKDERGWSDRVLRVVHGHAQPTVRIIAGAFSGVGVQDRCCRQDDRGHDRDRRDNAPGKKKTHRPMRCRSEIIDGSSHVWRGSLEADGQLAQDDSRFAYSVNIFALS